MLNGKALTQRLDELEILPSELAALVRRPLDEVEGWLRSKTALGGEASVLLRALADAEDAQRRVSQLRRTFTQNMAGDGARYAQLPDIPYGTSDRDRVTGGMGA